MKLIGIGISLALVLATSAGAEPAPKYNPFGVKNDVAIATVLSGGWRVLYQGKFSEVLPFFSDVLKRACGQIMLANKHMNSDNFDVLATIDAVLYQSLYTSRNETFLTNGAQWYKNEFSMGFAGAGDTISQTSADIMALKERDRLSWHTMYLEPEKTLQMNGGWRSGDNYELNKSDDWKRFILTTKPTSAGLPTATKLDCLPVG